MKTIKEEQQDAVNKYGHYNSTHEAYAVLQEEVEEFWELVRQSKQDGKLKSKMINELTQIAAVAKRTISELEKNQIKWV